MAGSKSTKDIIEESEETNRPMQWKIFEAAIIQGKLDHVHSIKAIFPNELLAKTYHKLALDTIPNLVIL